MIKGNIENQSKNLEYLIHCVNPGFNHSQYVQGQTFPGLKISLSTLKNALYGRSISERTLRQIAYSFSLSLNGTLQHTITEENLSLSPQEFKKMFPPESFKHSEKSESPIFGDLFLNKLFLGYYMIPSAPYSAYMAYFKIFMIGQKPHACMVRGIQDLSLVKDIRNNFDSPNKLIQCMEDRKRQATDDKRMESIHLYMAEAQDIRITENCIKIDFHPLEKIPCYCTMYWNINLANNVHPSTYIGGSSLIVDTNDGVRGKDIQAFKMGLEVIDETSDAADASKSRLNPQSLYLIKELSLPVRNGILQIDNADDSRWFRFLRDTRNNSDSPDNYQNIDVPELLKDLVEIRDEYQREMLRMRAYVDDLKKVLVQKNPVSEL